MHIKLINGQPQPYNLGQLRRDNPQVSFPSSIPADTLAEYDVYEVATVAQPSYNHKTHNITQTIQLVSGVWTQTWTVTPASKKEIAEREAAMRSDNKQWASALLSETDYTDLPNTADKILNLPAILAYREALRSIAINPPVTVDQWPTKPETEWSS